MTQSTRFDTLRPGDTFDFKADTWQCPERFRAASGPYWDIATQHTVIDAHRLTYLGDLGDLATLGAHAHSTVTRILDATTVK